MTSITERAKIYMEGQFRGPKGSYVQGSIDQQKIDIEKAFDITVKLLKEANVRVTLMMESVIYSKIKQAMEE